MAKIKILSDTQTTYPDITINGNPITVLIDNREDGNLIVFDNNGIKQALSAHIISVNYHTKRLEMLYDLVTVDNDLNIIARSTTVLDDVDEQLIQQKAWNDFYNTNLDDTVGVILAKFVINYAFEEYFNYKVFNEDGVFQQPIIIDETTIAETATYHPHYSEILAEGSAGLNIPDEPNADGQIIVNISDGGTPTIYRLLDINELVLREQAQPTFNALEAGDYFIQVTGPNAVGSGDATSVKKTTILKPLLLSIGSSTDSTTSTALVTVLVQNAAGIVQYKLDSGTFQTDNFFEDVPFGEHTLTAEDENGLQAVKILYL